MASKTYCFSVKNLFVQALLARSSWRRVLKVKGVVDMLMINSQKPKFRVLTLVTELGAKRK